jgi:hypothetical protein
MSVDND